MKSQEYVTPAGPVARNAREKRANGKNGSKWHITAPRLQAIISENADAIMVIDRAGIIRFANPAAERLFGRKLKELIGASFGYPVVDGETAGLDIIQKNGRTAVAEMRAVEILWEDERVYLTTLRDVTERHEMVAKLEKNRQLERYLAYHDAFTDLPNRQLFYERLRHAFSHANRYGMKLAIMFIDLDGFKVINDEHGHTTGDKVLQMLGKRLKDCVRKSDTIARLGGDEFTIMLGELSQVDDAAIVARKILEKISLPCTIMKKEFILSASIGISIYPNDGREIESLLRCADAAMYEAKKVGKNSYRYFNPNL